MYNILIQTKFIGDELFEMNKQCKKKSLRIEIVFFLILFSLKYYECGVYSFIYYC